MYVNSSLFKSQCLFNNSSIIAILLK